MRGESTFPQSMLDFAKTCTVKEFIQQSNALSF